MSRLLEMALKKAATAEHGIRVAEVPADLRAPLRDLCSAVRLLAEAAQSTEEQLESHTGSADSHRRLV